MIPTMIVLGLVFGRWWRATLIAAAVGWPTLLIAAGVDIELAMLPVAGALGAANAAIGILVHRALWLLVRGTTKAARKLVG
jgi:hypothetical protein